MDVEREDLKKKQGNSEFEQVRYKRRDGKKVNQNIGNKNGNKGANSSRIFYKLVEKEGSKEGANIGKEVDNEQMIDKGSPKKGWNVQVSEDGIELEKENIDVYEETSGSAKKMAQNDITSSYANVLNGIGEGYNRGCIILIGWDNDKVQCMIVHASDQAVLCSFEIQSTKRRLFCTFIHAEISGRLRKKLWSDLSNYKSMINDMPWVIMGDLNVCLNLEDHSEGISHMTQDMKDFKDNINDIK
ncbi:RNA-directed DNA polymerase, eukaryota, reverse transcriptase zinc-binding domain protein, partial [Tanacetum coccineum]